MRIRRMVWIVVLLALACGAIPAAGQGDGDATPADLRQLLSDPGCQAACVLGIEPGVTLAMEVPPILEARHVCYNALRLFPDDPGLTFTIDEVGRIAAFFPFAAEDARMIIGTGSDVVLDLGITGIERIMVDDVLEAFGPPSDIATDGEDYWLLYDSLRLDFHIGDDHTSIYHIHLNLPLTFSFVNPDDGGTALGSVLPCSEPAEICSIATATPTGD